MVYYIYPMIYLFFLTIPYGKFHMSPKKRTLLKGSFFYLPSIIFQGILVTWLLESLRS